MTSSHVFMNIFISNLKSLDIGCHVNQLFLGCYLYADDVILLCPTVNGLQRMLALCYSTSVTLSLQFNIKKCHCIVFGKAAQFILNPLHLGAGHIA